MCFYRFMEYSSIYNFNLDIKEGGEATNAGILG